ncbi:hypothetical protein PVK06_034542 [Gossypium arboreum]|uniref:Aminotransferase-like plant mobile domain-containing protein n=1 Tax=Gossypium arboreum TaxID=29729 RepID=A0ABR0NHE6_GOSAR|nr:hypothetical protein PVK06_034542 [Gossypium arboreum]
MENDLARLRIEEDEEEVWKFNGEGGKNTPRYEHCLVACFFTLAENKNQLEVPLVLSYFWVRKHDLPHCFFSEGITKQFGEFLGKFMEYDTKHISGGFRNYMRIKVLIDADMHWGIDPSQHEALCEWPESWNFFPHLVTALYNSTEVPMEENKQFLQPKRSLISDSMYIQYVELNRKAVY